MSARVKMSNRTGRGAWLPDQLVSDGPIYLALANRIAEDVARGRLRSGQRMPAHRTLATHIGLDVTTITRAYREAARRGLIASEAGRGTFVSTTPRIMGVPEGSTWTDLSLNIPPALEPDSLGPLLSASLSELISRPDLSSLLKYQETGNEANHRAAGAAWIARRGVDAPLDRTVITAGAQHAISATLLAIASPGETILTESLTYPGFMAVAAQLRLQVRGVSVDGEGLDPNALHEACRQTGAKLLYCTPTLHNPTTATASLARREALARVIRDCALTVIEDDTYGLLPRKAPCALSSLVPERCYYITTLSKTVAPGLRVGYLLAPTAADARLVDAAIRATTWMAPPLMLDIATRWVQEGSAAEVLALHRAEAGRRQTLARTILGRSNWLGAPSAYHAWLTLPLPWNTAEFTEHARRNGVLVTPGDAFTAPPVLTARAQDARGVRVAIGGARDIADLTTALQTLNALLLTSPESSRAVL